MNYEEVQASCIKICQKVTGIEFTPELQDALSFEQLCLDSLDILEVVTELELFFDVTLDYDHKLSNIMNIEKLTNLVFKELEQYTLISSPVYEVN